MSVQVAESAIFFAEVPNFYAEVERWADPSLRLRSIVVGGDPRKRGKVQSISPEAQASGVEVGMSTREALARCPGAVHVATNMKRYREASGALATCMREIFKEVETGGQGAVYAEIGSGPEEPEILAAQWLSQVTEKLGLPLRIGIAPSKFLARLAAEEAGTGAVFRLRGGEVRTFLDPLPISRLPRVGKRTAERLRKMGATNIADLLALGAPALEETFGNHGLAILEMARGQDRSPVRLARSPQSLSRAETFSEPSQDFEFLGECLRRLSETLQAAVESQGLQAERLALKLRWVDSTETTRSTTSPAPLLTAEQVYSEAVNLLGRISLEYPVRGMRVTVAGLKPFQAKNLQLDLFPS